MYRGINNVKKGHQPRSNIVRNEKGHLVTDCHGILARWRNHFSELFSIHGVNDVRQTEIHTAEPLVPEPSAFEVEMATEKLKSHESPGIDQIPAGGKKISYEINKLIISIWNKEELPEEWKESITVPIYTKDDKTDCSKFTTTNKLLSHILLSRLTPYAEEIIGDHQCGFRGNRSTTNHVFCISQIL